MQDTTRIVRVEQTPCFARWLRELADDAALARIVARIARVQSGNLGDWKPLGGGLSELRVNCGPGYRIYFALHGKNIIVLLCGGTKGTQWRDIESARELLGRVAGK